MKSILLAILFLITSFGFAQTTKSNTISIVRSEIDKTTVITDIIPGFPTECTVISFELLTKVGDNVSVNKGSNGDLFNTLKTQLKFSNQLSKSCLDLKMKCDSKSKVKTYCFIIKD